MKTKTSLAPIVIFAYRRLAHTKQTIQALQDNFLANLQKELVDGANKSAVAQSIHRFRELCRLFSFA